MISFQEENPTQKAEFDRLVKEAGLTRSAALRQLVNRLIAGKIKLRSSSEKA